ncbi:MAG: ABC transporter ATP-binding protein [Oscillospiraceae bacterium]|nr:ABC transporter ATP-binding protein [Oscillospiraceae bacterium]
MSERLLDIRGLSVSFDTPQGTVRALRDVNLHVNRGEILGLVGESGSGKSVTMLSCLGLLARNGRIDSGSILFEGQELSAAGLSSRAELRTHENMLRGIRGNRIGMIFQDPMTYMNPVLSIGTQLTEGLVAHGKCSRQEAWQKGTELLRKVGISNPERRMRQYPYEFSGGQRQRMIIAAALACEPQLLIADEPTTALDVTVQAQILDLIRGLARENGTAVILITHDLGVVASLCDRITVLYGGKVCETGTSDEIFYETKHPYTEGLLQSVARRDSTGGGSARGTLVSIPGSPPDLLRIRDGCPFAARCEAAMKICRDYVPAVTDFGPQHTAACWLYCKERAGELVAAQDRERGEQND